MAAVASGFAIKDSGARAQFDGGMVRDTTEGKANFLNVRFGPLLRRWAEHTTKGRDKYPDVAPGVPNWTLARGVEEYLRFKESAARHFEQWLAGDRDEDHAAAVVFNMNGAEFVLEQDGNISPALGVSVNVPQAIPVKPVTVPGPMVEQKMDLTTLDAIMREPEPLNVGDRVRVVQGSAQSATLARLVGEKGVIVEVLEYPDDFEFKIRLDNEIPSSFKVYADELERV